MDSIINEISSLSSLVVCGIGAFTAAIGLMNFAEGSSNTDPAAKLNGGKFIFAGVVIFAVGFKLVPMIFDTFKI